MQYASATAVVRVTRELLGSAAPSRAREALCLPRRPQCGGLYRRVDLDGVFRFHCCPVLQDFMLGDARSS